MKVAVIIPDRGDRPEFLEQCFKMLDYQTRKPDKIVLANWVANSEECDITERYRIAYNGLNGCGFDCVLFMENDDFYAPNYIETMIREWVSNGKPDLFGTKYTIYYHLGIKMHVKFDHPRRASMMNTLLKTDMVIDWCEDNYPYTDAWLWNKIVFRKTFCPESIISLGIKHGIGKSGGEFHRTRMQRYHLEGNKDENFEFLTNIVGSEMIKFYKKIHKKAFKG